MSILQKGIEEAIAAIEVINEENKTQVCTLDIYGRIDDNYKDRFKRVISEASDSIKYKGSVDYDKSVEVLKDYYALLFPTHWHGEGFPGTIIDAFSAGIPVIASDWNSNGEIITDGENGILYPSDKVKSLKYAIEFLVENNQMVKNMKTECLKCAVRYKPDIYISKIIKTIERTR